MKNRYIGPLGSVIKCYLKVRRSLGAVLKTDEYTLHPFDQYLAKHFPNVKVMTRAMIVGYLEPILISFFYR